MDIRTLCTLLLSLVVCASCTENTTSKTKEPPPQSQEEDTADMADVAEEPDAYDLPQDLPKEPQLPPHAIEGACEFTPWTPGTPAFVNKSASWGLTDIQARGSRLSVADFDGDGWPDLAVRMHGVAADDFENETRHTWLLRNTGQGTFEDITESSAARKFRSSSENEARLGRPGEVFAFADVNNDGHQDIYTGLNTTSQGLEVPATSEIMLNNGDGTFRFGPENSAIRRMDDVPSGASFVDINLDGKVDLWVSQSVADNAREPTQDRLYLGDGEGGFVEVTEDAGVETFGWTPGNLNFAQAHTFAWGAAACDLNNDGYPELLASSYGRGPNQLWLHNADTDNPEYSNRSIGSGYAFDHRKDWSDNESARCFCKLNPNAENCDGVPAPRVRCTSEADILRWNHNNDQQNYRLGGNTGTTVCADLNNDGYLDLLTTEIVHWDVGSSSDPSEILFNTQNPEVHFDRPGNESTGLTRTRTLPGWNDGDITGALFDFDNDGWKDVYIGATDYPDNRGLLFHQTSPERFAPVSPEDGPNHPRSHGVAVADFDRDGDLDLVVGHSRARCGQDDDPTPCLEDTSIRLFENISTTNAQWLQLNLEGTTSNRAAVGARIEVRAGSIIQVLEVDGGHGHYGIQNDQTLHFGLGRACEAEVTVRWPDAAHTTQTFTLTSQRRYRVVQGSEPTPEER